MFVMGSQVPCRSAWSDEEEGHNLPAAPVRLPPAGPPGTALTTQQPAQPAAASKSRTHSAPKQRGAPLGWQQQPATQEAEAEGPPTLRALCLSLLGEYLEELIEMGEEVLPLLPAELKACLLAVARLRRLLTDTALLLLADREQLVLDLYGCGSALSDAGIRTALQRMPQLRYVDLRGCGVGAETLRVLGGACPQVRVLRLGSKLTDAAPGIGNALRANLPGLDKREAPAVESWEDSWEALGASDTPPAGAGRLMQLQCLVWPRMPFRLQQHCTASCPAVVLNPSPEELQQHSAWPPEFSPAYALDGRLLAGVAHAGRWVSVAALQQSKQEEGGLVPIAERFRLAYVSRAQRLRAKEEREAKRQWRRAVRDRSRAEQIIRQWESEL